MRKILIAVAVAAFTGACQPPSAPSSTTTTPNAGASLVEPVSEAASNISASAPYIVAALASTRRPEQDHAADATRHPGETLALSEVAPGQKIGELMAGEGYFTRLFSLAVGRQGHVYTIVRLHPSQYEHPVAEDMGNVSTIHGDYDHFTLPEPVDLVFTARNYHDLKIESYHMGDTLALDRAAFAALRPGGIYVVIDHSAIAGSAVDQVHPLHRIDQAEVRREVESVGFVYDGESQILRNPGDPRTANIFDPVIRGHTDQFFMRFRRPN